MCGLVGISSKNPNINATNKSKFIKEALIMDTLRGIDSTGIIAVPDKHRKLPQLQKRAVPGWEFVNLPHIKNFIGKKINEYSTIIGHNRAATSGWVTDQAAHPYIHSHISLVHNGTLKYNHGLKGDFEVDSEHIPYTMSVDGELQTLEKINGAYALVWYNSKNETLNFARNNERPLAFALTEDGKTLAWASEMAMLRSICARNRAFDMTKTTFSELKVGRWLRFKLADTSFEQYEATEFKPYVPTYNYNAGAQYRANQAWNQSGKKAKGGAADNLKKPCAPTLRELGLFKGDYVYMHALRFESYKTTPTRGNLVCNTNKKGIDEVHIPMNKEEAEDFLNCKNGIFHGYGPVSSTYYSHLSHKAILLGKDFYPQYSTEEMKSEDCKWVYYLPDMMLEAEKKKADEVLEQEPLLLEQSTMFYAGPNGTILEYQVMKNICDKGCSICGDNIPHTDYDDTTITDNELAICGYCMMDLETSRSAI